MSEDITVTPDIRRTLSRYLEIQREEKRLEEEKQRLRQVLISHMAAMGKPVWFPLVDRERLRVRCTSRVEIKYREAVLRERLADRYASILAPDPAKLRKHLSEVEPYLEPVLELVGTPSRDKVRSAIASGIVSQDEFKGAFAKSVKRTLSVMRASDFERNVHRG